MRRQSLFEKRLLLVLHCTWFGLTTTINLLFVYLSVRSILDLDVTTTLSGIGGIIATAPGVAHYLRLVLKSRWQLQHGVDNGTGLFW